MRKAVVTEGKDYGVTLPSCVSKDIDSQKLWALVPSRSSPGREGAGQLALHMVPGAPCLPFDS